MRKIIITLSGYLLLSTVIYAIDLDGNGRSDVWDRKYGISPIADNFQDDDYDGYSLLDESLLGSDPANYSETFNFTLDVHTTPNQIHILLQGKYGKVYQFESSLDKDAAIWDPLGDVVAHIGAPLSNYSSPPSASGVTVYYRIRLVGDVNEDRDLLTAWEENELGTSDNMTDSDGDRVDDGIEYGLGTDPAVSLDDDNDGMADDWELLHFGGLQRDGSGDYEGDGFSDSDEFLYDQNPTVDDSTQGNRQDFRYSKSGRITNVLGAMSAAYVYDANGNMISAQ